VSISGTRKNLTPAAPIPLDVLRKKIAFGDAIDRDDKEELKEAESHPHAEFTSGITGAPPSSSSVD
jgi:hypothetical protein